MKSGARTARQAGSQSFHPQNSLRPKNRREGASKKRAENKRSENGPSLLSQTMMHFPNELSIHADQIHPSLCETQRVNGKQRGHSNSISYPETDQRGEMPPSSVQTTREHLRSMIVSQRDDG